MRRKFIAIQAYLKKIEKIHINNLTPELEEQQAKPRTSRRMEISEQN